MLNGDTGLPRWMSGQVLPGSLWWGVSRHLPPAGWDCRGGCTTAGAWVAGTRPAMTERESAMAERESAMTDRG